MAQGGRVALVTGAGSPGGIGFATARARAGRATLLGRSGTPDAVAACAVFPASDAASSVTGAMLVVDGGNVLQEMKG